MCWMLTSGCVKQSSKVGGRGGGAGGGQGAAGGRDGRLGGLAGGSSGLAGDSGGLGAAGSGDWGLRGAGVEGGEGGEPGGMGGRKGLVERNVAIVMERVSSVNSRAVETSNFVSARACTKAARGPPRHGSMELSTSLSGIHLPGSMMLYRVEIISQSSTPLRRTSSASRFARLMLA